jgi:hypothetical protein
MGSPIGSDLGPKWHEINYFTTFIGNDELVLNLLVKLSVGQSN